MTRSPPAATTSSTVSAVENRQREIAVRRATEADIAGVVASGTSLFLEDGVTHDRLRNPDWPRSNAETYERANLADPNTFVLVAEHGGTEIIGHLTGSFHERDGFIPLETTFSCDL